MENMKKVFVKAIILTLMIYILTAWTQSKTILKENKEIRNLISINDYSELNNKNGYYYFGRPDCLSCVDFQEILEHELYANKDITVFYINTAYWKKENKNFSKLLEDNSIDSVPVVILFENNIEVSRYARSDSSILKSYFAKEK